MAAEIHQSPVAQVFVGQAVGVSVSSWHGLTAPLSIGAAQIHRAGHATVWYWCAVILAHELIQTRRTRLGVLRCGRKPDGQSACQGARAHLY